MADEGKLRVQMERGQRADALLNNELLQEAFAKIEEEIDKTWKESKPHEEDVRRDAYYTHINYRRLRGYLSKIVTEGDAAKKQLIPKPGVFKR